MIFNIHAGHNPDDKPGCGAIGLLKESTENRKVKNRVIELLEARGHTVYDCTVDDGLNQRDVLKKIVEKCNKHKVDLDISIHFNAGAKKNKNNKTTGCEAYVYNSNSKAKKAANNVLKEINKLGFNNRGVKTNAGFYVLKHTVNPAMLIECCFVDDPDDVEKYNYLTMAEAIVSGLTGLKAVIPERMVRVPNNTIVFEYPDKNSAITYTIKNSGVYTIVDNSNGFGKLKSGIGWIDLNAVNIEILK